MAASMTNDGCFVLAGHTEGVFSGEASAGGEDFAAVKLDAEGQEVWRWQVRSFLNISPERRCSWR